MKKITAIVLCFILVAASGIILVSCSKNEPEKEESTTEAATEATTNEGPEGEIVGGWTRAESPAITDDFKKVFEKATAELTGVDYEPVAYLSSQVVAGKNHRVLCTATVVVPDAEPTYAILQIYEDLQGNAEVTEIRSCEAKAESSGTDGGWSESDTFAVTDEAKAALEKACETLTGAEYTPVALLATQVVAGTNYRILCESKATVPNAETGYVIVTVYADLQGNAEITETYEFTGEAEQAEDAAPEAESDTTVDAQQ